MSGIIPTASRTAFKRTVARTTASRTSLRYTSTMHDNDPEVLEREKQRNLSKQQHKTSTPIPNAPGWNEHLASASEASIKAQPQAQDAVPNEPGVSTQTMKSNGAGSTEAPYPRDEVDGPLKKAHGTVVETVEHKEDKITRQVI
ncbi:hypothetical protein DICSQDRAFT_73600 [Dichomitus squalens LYAD-421 SS1]|uniref:Uncharacterized protein n=1 Tax=Dichomitus squalens (strain LYAD-421) TaxID=732165 RepID=R7SI45_DICSQ|nr:uncharacterized protein DICSQDRAFT_73600 [Dichomitus squalens LYAD-421 SS1]EJF55538.1 hypothetical protein DICSQDRAFT_73600 [Dichomitus squalens LYAD-421 SS1]